ncbi:F-box/kelch-repeat protein SKIP25 [Cornus florida]|uniref:F-box/kelch-repeat protein SKIP25 n=1 Tax=Cornus florida TaxID=4283 RepID=UPI0028A2275B|nr:F-box/kelch-repeat protein SKIP25 [Cornus florida]
MSPIPKTTGSTSITTTGSAVKRRKLTGKDYHQPLLPGLPDHIAQLCLSPLPPSLLYSVCRSWRRLIYSPSFPPFLSLYALFLSDQTTQNSNSINFFSFDPISSKWHSLPPPPPDPPLHLLLRHPSFISRNLPIQSVAVSGHLILLAATADHFLPALPRPLIFNPISNKWVFGPPLAAPRRWCAAGSYSGEIYVASGIGSHYTQEVARSVEKMVVPKNQNYCYQRNSFGAELKWEKLGALRDGKLSRDAIEAVGWRGRLCMVNVRGYATKEGVVYDVGKDEWEEMPAGMVAGWRGPAATMDEETIFVVDESKGVLRRYEPEKDVWMEMFESEKLRGAKQMAAGGGRVCVTCGGGSGIVVVDVVASPPRLWVVDTPPGFETLAVHVLPRINQPDFQTLM